MGLALTARPPRSQEWVTREADSRPGLDLKRAFLGTTPRPCPARDLRPMGLASRHARGIVRPKGPELFPISLECLGGRCATRIEPGRPTGRSEQSCDLAQDA